MRILTNIKNPPIKDGSRWWYTTINGIEYDQIIVTEKNGEVLAVISDKEIIEKDGYKVALDLT